MNLVRQLVCCITLCAPPHVLCYDDNASLKYLVCKLYYIVHPPCVLLYADNESVSSLYLVCKLVCLLQYVARPTPLALCEHSNRPPAEARALKF